MQKNHMRYFLYFWFQVTHDTILHVTFAEQCRKTSQLLNNIVQRHSCVFPQQVKTAFEGYHINVETVHACYR